MRIAFFVTRFPSLSQTFVLGQITGLLDRGHEVEIFARGPGDDAKIHEDVIEYGLLKHTHYFLKTPPNRLLRTFKGLWLIGRYLPRYPAAVLNSLNIFKHGISAASLVLLFQTIPFLNEKAFDIIHCHFGPNGINAVRLRGAGIISGKIVTVFHGFDLTSFFAKADKDIYKILFEKGDLFLPISKRWERKLIDLGCDCQKITVHRMGIDVDKIEPSTAGTAQNGKVKLLSVARLVEKKGIEYGIQAVSKLKETFPDLEYIILGDGPLKNELSELIDRLRMNRNIKLLGWMNQQETFTFMKRADIFLAPSVTGRNGDQEGIPVVLMEAMAHGLPVVSTHHSGIPELVVDNRTGFLVDERDASGLAAKIAHLISNRDLSVQFGDAGRRVVAQSYNTRRLNDELERTFLSITTKSTKDTKKERSWWARQRNPS